MQPDFNTAAAPEGKRAGVCATEIANTIEAVLGYFNATKTAHPKLLKAINRECKSWQAEVAHLRGADQEKLDKFFGQPAPADVTAALAAKGISRASGENEYIQAYHQTIHAMTKDPAAYYPGKPVPTLDDYRDILSFDAYREKLDGITDGPAAQLVKRLDAFEGAYGSKHGAGTGLISAISDHIAHTPRHEKEIYTPPAEVKVDYLNAFHHTYSSHVAWRPTADMQQVTAEACRGYSAAPDKKDAVLAHEAAKFSAALSRGGIKAAVEVRHGKTYGEDTVQVSMSMADYTKRFIPIMKGEIEIDTSIPGSKHDASFDTSQNYTGYEPGKPAFFERDNLLVSAAALKKIEAEYPPAGLEPAAEALDFLKAVNAYARKSEALPAAPGKSEEFVTLSPTFPKFDNKVTEVEGYYYSSTDLHNKINACLGEVECAINGKATPPAVFAPREDVSGLAPFEHKGDTYLPRSDKSYQAALYMQMTHGTDYTWVVNDKEAQPKCNGKDVYVIFTSKLDEAARARAVADLHRKLQEDPADARARAATILRKKIRVKSPLAYRQP